MCSDLAAGTHPVGYATDASDAKGAFVSTSIPREVSRVLWRTGRRKGGYVRMLSRERALLAKIDADYEEAPSIQGDQPRPSKPLALRFHFVEVCGGAGKIAKAMSARGWTVGPVLDLDGSPHFDLKALQFLSWMLFMVEQGRLDSYLVAPPCTSFSPAQYPSLRSYQCPRGHDPKEPRTLNGTTLALRALTLMMVAAVCGVIGLLEQPRRSKMAWLREWRRLIEVFGAQETHLASCNFESIHQKEFRLLGVNLNVNKLYHPCTRDHPHVKIEGKYTKASAVYTDALASRIADVLGEELRIKKAASNYFDIKIEGLESVLSNHFALASEWKEVKSWTWKKKVHINVLEAAAYGRLCYHAAVHHPRSRFPVGMDSNVALSSIIKGRSPSYALRPSLRRIGATTVVGCLYPAHHFFPTRMNPSDHPTRNSIIPPSSKGGKLVLASPEELLRLHEISGLKRFAANWARLVLALLGSSRPWTLQEESWRYGQHSYAGFPFSWICSQKVNRHLGFDKTLGFPGEGPTLVLTLLGLLLSVWIFVLGLHSPHSVSVCALLGLPFAVLRLPDFVLGASSGLKSGLGCCGPPVLVGLLAAMPWSVGAMEHADVFLDPRDQGDEVRARNRRGLELDDGRPVLGKTRDARMKLLENFNSWLTELGVSLDDLLNPQFLDIETVNLALEKYGRALYKAGRPYNHYAETINAVSAKRPQLRRVLQGAWDLAYTWLREEPPTHHLALPWQALLCLLSVAFCWNWSRVAGVVALSWGGIARIGEVLNAKRRHLVLPADLAGSINYSLLQIEEPKTRFKAARHQVARLDQPELLKVVEIAFETLDPGQALWPFSPQTLRKRFQKLVEASGLSRLPSGVKRGLDLGSLRAGGASWLLMVSEDSELVRRRGRWINNKVMEIYVQEAASIQFLPQLEPSVRTFVLRGTALFPALLQKVYWWFRCGLPENAWRILLTDGDTSELDGWK